MLVVVGIPKYCDTQVLPIKHDKTKNCLDFPCFLIQLEEGGVIFTNEWYSLPLVIVGHQLYVIYDITQQVSFQYI